MRRVRSRLQPKPQQVPPNKERLMTDKTETTEDKTATPAVTAGEPDKDALPTGGAADAPPASPPKSGAAGGADDGRLVA